jgi:hypothetical protein
MPATHGVRRGRRAVAGLAATALLSVALVTGAPTPQATGATTGNDDALQSRVRAELGVFTGWLAANRVGGYIGEVGWPNNADTAQWNALAAKWYADAAAAGVWTTAWATGEWWGCGYKLSVYVWSTCSTMDGTLNTARSQAPVIESQAAADNRGVNVAGGEFGTPGPLDATSSFSNANRGAYDQAYHYDLAASFSYLASRGISLVRLPIRWERVQPTLGGPLDAAEVQRIGAAVSRAQAAGLRVILDVHNYGAYWLFDGAQGVRQPIGSASVTVAHFATLWRLLSSSFAGHTGVTGYGLMNEPVGMAGAWQWEQASQAAVTAIRQDGDAKLVLVPGYNWSGAQQWTSQHPVAWIADPLRQRPLRGAPLLRPRQLRRLPEQLRRRGVQRPVPGLRRLADIDDHDGGAHDHHHRTSGRRHRGAERAGLAGRDRRPEGGHAVLGGIGGRRGKWPGRLRGLPQHLAGGPVDQGGDHHRHDLGRPHGEPPHGVLVRGARLRPGRQPLGQFPHRHRRRHLTGLGRSASLRITQPANVNPAPMTASGNANTDPVNASRAGLLMGSLLSQV